MENPNLLERILKMERKLEEIEHRISRLEQVINRAQPRPMPSPEPGPFPQRPGPKPEPFRF